MTSPGAHGTVALFRGYGGGRRSSMPDKADAFPTVGLKVFTGKFYGAAGSEGAVTIVGFKEAEATGEYFSFRKTKAAKISTFLILP